MLRGIFSASLLVGASFIASSAACAEAQGAADGGGVGDIIVTAQRREQTLLEVPLSITAIKGETLAAAGVAGVTDLRFNTPGFATATGSGFTQIFIRGIGNQIYVGADPSVATFIDDTPRTFGTIVDDLLNVDRVEVLKGAQGGLYGRNATGGVVNVITRQPQFGETSIKGRVSYGSRKTFEAGVLVNLPITENVAIALSGVRRSHDEYTPNRAIKNPYQSYAALSASEAAAYGDTGQRAFLRANPAIAQALDSVTENRDLTNQDLWSFDGKIAFQGDGFKVTLQGDYSRKDDASGIGWFQPAADRQKTFGTYSFIMGLFGFGSASLPFNYVFPENLRKSKYDTYSSYGADAGVEDYGGSAKAEIDLPGFTLTSISSLRWNSNFFRGDVGSANVPVAGFDTPVYRRNFYQEFRAVSNGDGPFRWLGGASFYSGKDREFSLLATLGFPNPAEQVSMLKTKGFSAYGQLEYNLNDKLTVTGSLRWIAEKKDGFFPAQTVPLPVGGAVQFLPVGEASTTTGWVKKVLPSVTLSYGLDSGGTIYARWARGVKTGGVNPVVHPKQIPTGEPNVFKPETVDTYEAGLRTSFMNGQLQFTSAIFYNDYKDLQVTRGGVAGVIQLVYFNAGSAETYGAEASLAWRPSRVFSMTANVGYLNAKYITFASPGIPALGVAAFNVSGNRMPYSSKWQGSLTANLDVPVNDKFNAVGTVLYSYSSRYFTELTNYDPISQKGYSMVNLRAGVKTSDDRLGVYIGVKNLFNQFYKVYGTEFGGAGSAFIPGSPRIIQGSIEFNF